MAWPSWIVGLGSPPILAGIQDPTVTATDGQTGSLFIKLSSPIGLFQKLDTGLNTNWRSVSSQSGQLVMAVKPLTSAYVASATDGQLPCDATSGAFSVSLPTAGTSLGQGQVVSVQKVDSSANAVTCTGLLGGNRVLNFQGDALTAYYYPAISLWVPIA